MFVWVDVVSLLITNACDRHCSTCACGDFLRRERYNATVEELALIAPYLRGLKRLVVSGGEPTMHPQLATLALLLRDSFRPQSLVLATNAGPHAMEAASLFRYFDEVRCTIYTEETYPGCESN